MNEAEDGVCNLERGESGGAVGGVVIGDGGTFGAGEGVMGLELVEYAVNVG